MNPAIKTLSLMALCCAATSLAVAQQPAAPPAAPPVAAPGASAASGATTPPGTKSTKATAQSEAGEPRADTSNPPTGAPAGAPAVGPAPAASPATTSRPTPPGHAAAAPAKIDRLDLGTATVTGDREQPKVMYIVPWKRSDIGDLAGKPMNSLVDEILAPVDRDVFKREVVYYQAVQATASQNAAPPKPAQQGEK
jgi:hypothetical protein